MNEKITQLWRQVELQECDCGCNPDEFLRLKFAEMIVRECADLYNHEDVLAPIGMSAWGEAHQHGWIEGTKTYRDTILEHFGVEE